MVRCARCSEPRTEEADSALSPHAIGRDGKGRQGAGLRAAAEPVCKEVGAEKGAGLRHNWREEDGEEESPQLEGGRVQSGDGGIALARERSHTSWRQARGLAIGEGETDRADGALF